jgi:hypothetical protein
VTDFQGLLGSSSLDSFLKRSSASGQYDSATGIYKPFYSQTSSVTLLRPGRLSTQRPPTAAITHQLDEEFLRGSPKATSGIPRAANQKNIELQLRPMSTAAKDLDHVLPPQALDRQQDETEQQDIQPDKKLQDKKIDYEKLKAQAHAQADDIYEQMKAQLDEILKNIEAKQVQDAEKSDETTDDSQQEDKKEQLFDSKTINEINAVKASRILGEHKTFVSYNKDKFNHYMSQAEEYLRKGKYYRAADAYALATMFKKDDPLAYAGRSHALFAAGEYMSSALFLARAMEMFDAYAYMKIDLETMFQGRDKIETRITDVQKCLEVKPIGELHFLLAYLYHNLGRPDSAKEAIDTAFQRLPDSRAVISLKSAIYKIKQ